MHPQPVGDPANLPDVTLRVGAQIRLGQDHDRYRSAGKHDAGVARDAVVTIVVVQGGDDEDIVRVRGHVLHRGGLCRVRPLQKTRPFADGPDHGGARRTAVKVHVVPYDRPVLRRHFIEVSLHLRRQVLPPEADEETPLVHCRNAAGARLSLFLFQFFVSVLIQFSLLRFVVFSHIGRIFGCRTDRLTRSGTEPRTKKDRGRKPRSFINAVSSRQNAETEVAVPFFLMFFPFIAVIVRTSLSLRFIAFPI